MIAKLMFFVSGVKQVGCFAEVGSGEHKHRPLIAAEASYFTLDAK